jgi:hypothetical protein
MASEHVFGMYHHHVISPWVLIGLTFVPAINREMHLIFLYAWGLDV